MTRSLSNGDLVTSRDQVILKVLAALFFTLLLRFNAAIHACQVM